MKPKAINREHVAALVKLLHRLPMHDAARAPKAEDLLVGMMRVGGKALDWFEIVEAFRVHVCTLRETIYADERARSSAPRPDPIPVRPKAQARRKRKRSNVDQLALDLGGTLADKT